MNMRKWKIAALLATSSVLLQIGACLPIIFQLLAEQVITDAINSAITGADSGTP